MRTPLPRSALARAHPRGGVPPERPASLTKRTGTSLPSLLGHFKDHLELDWHAQRQARDPDYHANRCLLCPEDAFEQLGRGIGDLRHIEEVAGRCQVNAQSYDSRDSIE